MPRYRGKHRRPSTTSRTTTTTTKASLGAVVAIGSVAALTVPASAATADDFARLRACESGGNYSANTGNGFYGAYQFALGTWHSLGYSGLPSSASPATQDAAARRLQAAQGWSPWPACSAHLGLTESHASRSTIRTVAALHASTGGWHGTYFTTELVSQARSDVRAWQARMRTNGYHLAVDGQYGPESRGVALAFQRAHGLAVDGIVGPQTWAASFR